MAASSVVATEAAHHAAAAAEQPSGNQLDGLLLSALANPRDRLTILKLDYELERFIRESRQNRLEFPPMSSYQRLIVHRIAHYFRLDHAVLDSDGTKRSIVLFKTPQSKIPALRFADLVEQEEAPAPPSVKIMRRGADSSNNSKGGSSSSATSSPTMVPVIAKKPMDVKPTDRAEVVDRKLQQQYENAQQQQQQQHHHHQHLDAQSEINGHTQENGANHHSGKSLEEREADYARARARIFNDQAPQQSADGSSPSPSSFPSSPSPSSSSSAPPSSIPSPPPPSPPPAAARTSPGPGNQVSPAQQPPQPQLQPQPPQLQAIPKDARRLAKPSPHHQLPLHPLAPPHWEHGHEYLMEDPLAQYYVPPPGVLPGSPWGEAFFFSSDAHNAFTRASFPPPMGAPPTPLARPFVPDPRTPLPYAAVAAGKTAKPHTSNNVVNTITANNGSNNNTSNGHAVSGKDAPSPPLPLPVPLPVQLPEDSSVLGLYTTEKPPDPVYGPMGFQSYAPVAPWPVYAPFPPFAHPAYGPPYPTAPISASLEYERRPPARSMELFDPKAPATTQQRRNNGNAFPQPQVYPGCPQLFDPSAPAPGVPVRQASSPAVLRSAPLNGHPQAPRPGRAEKPPARSGTVKPYFDYSQSTNGDGATIPPPAPNHILEICNIAASIKPEEPGDAFSEIKSAGSAIKVLEGGAVVAIFKTSIAAKAALSRVRSPLWELRMWTPVVAPLPATPEAMHDGEQHAKTSTVP